MPREWLIWALLVLGTIVAMEAVATLVHRYIMHGFGWSWHRSHHEPGPSRIEKNDLYAVVFSLISLLLFLAANRWPWLAPIAIGMVVYGLLYALLHDGLVHRRVPFMRPPKSGYIKRLVQAHRLHHAAREREGAVSYGFLYAPAVRTLRHQLRSKRDSA
jgi:beta-carotene 3-hydroxylase